MVFLFECCLEEDKPQHPVPKPRSLERVKYVDPSNDFYKHVIQKGWYDTNHIPCEESKSDEVNVAFLACAGITSNSEYPADGYIACDTLADVARADFMRTYQECEKRTEKPGLNYLATWNANFIEALIDPSPNNTLHTRWFSTFTLEERERILTAYLSCNTL